MKELIMLLVFCFSSLTAFGQDNKDFNFILVIDDTVWITYTNLKIEIRDNTDALKHTISALYYPGNLSLEEEDYEKILEAKGDSMALIIDYDEQGKKTVKNSVFELPFTASWLNNYFMVMKIYNLDNKQYKGVFEPLSKEKNYTYELNYPGGQMLRIRNKKQKKN